MVKKKSSKKSKLSNVKEDKKGKTKHKTSTVKKTTKKSKKPTSKKPKPPQPIFKNEKEIAMDFAVQVHKKFDEMGKKKEAELNA